MRLIVQSGKRLVVQSGFLILLFIVVLTIIGIELKNTSTEQIPSRSKVFSEGIGPTPSLSPREVIIKETRYESDKVTNDSLNHYIIPDKVARTLTGEFCERTNSFEKEWVAHENENKTFPVFLRKHSYYLILLCLSKHEHHHSLFINSRSDPKSDCDIYISTKQPPDQLHWDWKSTDKGSDAITITSYSHELQSSQSGAVFISTWGKSGENFCDVSVTISSVSPLQLLHKVSSLRGGKREGQILLPRDIKMLTG